MNRKYSPYGIAAAVALLTLVIYLPALQNDFVNWDDGHDVLDNLKIRSLNAEFFHWALTDTELAVYWQPVTWIAHAVDHAIWGMNPFGFHLTNILLHTVNTYLVFLLIMRLLDRPVRKNADRIPEPHPVPGLVLLIAGVTSILFGIHPLHAESVVWISQKKELLYALFYLMSCLSYLGHAAQFSAGRSLPDRGTFKRYRYYVLSLLFFALSLASKPMAVTLPVILLIMDWYPLQRMKTLREAGTLIVEKIPYIALSSAIVAATVIQQKAFGTLPTTEAVPLVSRAAVAVWALAMYLWKMVAPLDLSPLYPYPAKVSLAEGRYVGSIIAVSVISCAVLLAAKKNKLWLSAWSYYVVSLLPVLGLVQVGYHSMADRFTYLTSLGPFLAAGISFAWGWENCASVSWKRGAKAALTMAALACVGTLCYLTVQQTGVWKNSISLWSTVINRTPGQVPLAYLNRGIAYAELHQWDRALADFNMAITLDPQSPEAYSNRGRVYHGMGKSDIAVKDFGEAIARDPGYYRAYNNRGLAFKDSGQLDLALSDYSTAVSLNPEYAPAYTNRGIVFGETGQFGRAFEEFSEAIRVNPYYEDAFIGRGLVLARTGDASGAIEDFNHALRLNPASAEAYFNRGVIYEQAHELERAVVDYGRAIDINPNDSLAYSSRGNVLGLLGRRADAVRDFTKSIALRPDDPAAYIDRGNWLREMGEQGPAQSDFRKACQLGSAAGCAAAGALR